MLERRELFPHVIELNFQARRRLGCCIYLVFDGPEWMLIDIGYEDSVEELIEMIRQMDFPLSGCRYLVATHADVDHVQGLAKAKQMLPDAVVVGHPHAKELLGAGDRIQTYAEISAQGIDLPLPIIEVEQSVTEGDQLKLGSLSLDVWHTPGHAEAQLAFKMGDILFSGDNIYRDGCVGNIDAHHGSDLEDFVASLERIRDCDAKWLLPSHGPAFKNDKALLNSTIERLQGYMKLADFGTCAIEWPLLDEWDNELLDGIHPNPQ